MTDTNQPTKTLDWRLLVPPVTYHHCDCDRCDSDGEPDPIDWPVLFTLNIRGVDYVTDRYLAIRADLAPVPDDYEGHHSPLVIHAPAFADSTLKDEPATGLTFRWQTHSALKLLGAHLRRTDHPVTKSGSEVAAIVQHNDVIGWAMSCVIEADLADGTNYRAYQELIDV